MIVYTVCNVTLYACSILYCVDNFLFYFPSETFFLSREFCLLALSESHLPIYEDSKITAVSVQVELNAFFGLVYASGLLGANLFDTKVCLLQLLVYIIDDSDRLGLHTRRKEI